MKGIELPINVLVIVALAVIVLLGMIALYMAGTSGPIGSIALGAAKQSGCAKLLNSNNCGVDPDYIGVNFDVDGDGMINITSCDGSAITCPDNLGAFLNAYFGTADDMATQKQTCGCPGY